jgi:hypothetical protein
MRPITERRPERFLPRLRRVVLPSPLALVLPRGVAVRGLVLPGRSCGSISISGAS